MKLAAFFREVEDDRDNGGVLQVRKEIIGSAMAFNFNGQWEVRRLFPHLQTILGKYSENFQGTPIADSINLDGEVNQSN